MEPLLSIIVHENYGISLASQNAAQRSFETPNIRNVAGIVALALRLNIPVLAESGNSRVERTDLAAGVSSRTAIFKLQKDLVGLQQTVPAYGGRLVVSKHLPKGYAQEESQRYKALVRDIICLSHTPILAHENFVKIIAIGWEDAEDIVYNRVWPVLILEFAEYGTLDDFFELDDTNKSWETKLSLCGDIAAGLCWLHECQILHSDIKFQNVLIFEKLHSQTSPPYRAKISDFGFAIDMDSLDGQENVLLEGFTPPCAPESGSPIPLSLLTKVDVYSYGVLASRIFVNGDNIFDKEPLNKYQDLSNLSATVYEICEQSGIYNELQLQLVRRIVDSTTSAKAEFRVEMKQILNIVLSTSADEDRSVAPGSIHHEEKDGPSIVPNLEEVWALGLTQKVQRTIVSDLIFAIENYDMEASGKQEGEQNMVAKSAYQLYLAYLVGFGCEQSTESAIQYLNASARLGYEEAQSQIYATYSALSMDITSFQQDEIKQWLAQAAFEGDKACLQELWTFDTDAHEAVRTSVVRQRAMCERSGFIFDDEFLENHDVQDVERLLSDLQNSDEPIDEDLGAGMTWLHYAVFTGSVKLAARLLDDLNFPINTRNSMGQTPLWIACLGGNAEMSTCLINRGADAGIESDAGSSTLHHLPAFDDQDAERMAFMLQNHGSKVNGQNAIGLTPLHYAVRGSGNLKEEHSVAALLALGANPLIPDEDGDTPLDSAIYTLRPFYVENFISVTSMPKQELNKLLANSFGNWVRQLKHHRLRSGSLYYRERIANLIRFLHTDDIVSLYVANHPVGYTPLHDAYAWCSDDLAAEIIHIPNVDLDRLDTKGYGYTPLMIAIRTSSKLVVQKLIDGGANPLVTARTGENVLHHCVQYNPGLLSYICDQIELQRGDLQMMCNQASFKKGDTPLDYALSVGHAESVTFLLSRGANPNSLKESQLFPTLQVNSLSSCLSPPSVQTKSGDSAIGPFINATIDHFPSAINTPGGPSSPTPLHIAAAFGNVTAVKTLLRRGANPFLTDKNGNTPYDLIPDDDDEDREDGSLGLVKQRSNRRFHDLRQLFRQSMEIRHETDGESIETLHRHLQVD
ncbi:ankyrin [Stipitochalara longipes BDJ]|nr:ankyrin [Stipitochalara longipes BDJ]